MTWFSTTRYALRAHPNGLKYMHKYIKDFVNKKLIVRVIYMDKNVVV